MLKQEKGPRRPNLREPFRVRLATEHWEGNPKLTQSQAVLKAEEYRRASRANIQAAAVLGGRHGVALSKLAEHYARCAAALSVIAGGLPA